WNSAEGIKNWALADQSWGAESLENGLRPGGQFKAKMFARESGQGSDCAGTYDEVIAGQLIRYTMDDGRKVRIEFNQQEDEVEVKQWFDPETMNDIEYQKAGWQGFLDNFKRYVESVG